MNKGPGKRRRGGVGALTVLCAIVLLGLFCFRPSALRAEKWQGVDESVVEKYAKEHGREARKPLIDPGEGDLQLFVFLLAGVVGGFAAGYSWRMLVSEKRKEEGK